MDLRKTIPRIALAGLSAVVMSCETVLPREEFLVENMNLPRIDIKRGPTNHHNPYSILAAATEEYAQGHIVKKTWDHDADGRPEQVYTWSYHDNGMTASATQSFFKEGKLERELVYRFGKDGRTVKTEFDLDGDKRPDFVKDWTYTKEGDAKITIERYDRGELISKTEYPPVIEEVGQ